MAKKKAAPKKTPDAQGKAGKGRTGKDFDPTHESLDALSATLVEVREPRPYTSRYPIPEREFQKLKDAAHKRKLAKKGATLAKDTGKKAELSAAAIVEFAPAGGPVAAAPMPSTNFKGFSSTGWIPPDCTMATGPQHVMLSVNSSVAVYNKAGGAPALVRTLTVWFSNVIQGATIFDPKLLFDQHTGRWV